MSSRAYVDYGYGVDNLSDIFNNEKLSDFVKKHEKTLLKVEVEDIVDYVNKGGKDLLNEFKDYEGYYGCNYGIFNIVADVITKETGIRFDYCIEYETGYDGVVYMASYPWSCPEKEKNLTKEDVDKILREYLGDVAPDYIEFENYG